MPKLTIKAEVDAGASINDAAKEAVGLADKLNVYVEFDFNTVTCIAKPGGNAEKLVEGFLSQVTNGKKHKLAFA